MDEQDLTVMIRKSLMPIIDGLTILPEYTGEGYLLTATIEGWLRPEAAPQVIEGPALVRWNIVHNAGGRIRMIRSQDDSRHVAMQSSKVVWGKGAGILIDAERLIDMLSAINIGVTCLIGDKITEANAEKSRRRAEIEANRARIAERVKEREESMKKASGDGTSSRTEGLRGAAQHFGLALSSYAPGGVGRLFRFVLREEPSGAETHVSPLLHGIASAELWLDGFEHGVKYAEKGDDFNG